MTMTPKSAPPNSAHILYDRVAAHYEREIAPLVAPLAYDFIDSIPAVFIGQRALDIGTGTGLAAQFLAARSGELQIIGIDNAPAMLRHAEVRSDRVRYVLADIDTPPFAPESFDLIVASFGLALTVPRQSLSQVWELLKPGGWLFFQEWAAQDAISQVFDEVFALYTVSIPPDLTYADLPDEWSDQLQDVDDYQDCLSALGFAEIRAVEDAPVQIRTSIEAFIRYKFVWPTYRTDWQALDPISRVAFDSAVRARLADLAEANGTLIWQPALFRVRARRSM